MCRVSQFLGYLFSSEVTAAMESYVLRVADSVLEKAKKLCNNVEKVASYMNYLA